MITRVLPDKKRIQEGGGMFGVGSSKIIDDYDMVGVPVRFKGIANGLIYFNDGLEVKMSSTDNFPLKSLPLQKYKEGWELYINPEEL